MGSHHSGGHSHGAGVEVDQHVVRTLWTSLALLAVLVAVALAVLWPRGDGDVDDPLQLAADPMPADVVADDVGACAVDVAFECRSITFEVTGGEYAGETGRMEIPLDSSIRAGDGILVTAFETEAGRLVFDFYDFRRGSPMVVLVALFAVSVVALGRWRGVGALAGLAVSLFVITVFAVPAILDGSNAVTVAVVTASLIAFSALFLAHGFELSTAVALVSTLLSLLLTAVLAWTFVGATHLTGLTDDSTLLLSGLRDGIDARGILLAGIVIGALGVLDDVTVTQVSAVWEMKSLRPDLAMRDIVGPAMRIGRDHIASTVNTLFLAYAGAALPLLLLFTEADQGLGSVITREIVAVEVVRTLVGSIGLVASVPISTWLAAWVVTQARHSEAEPAVSGDAAPS